MKGLIFHTEGLMCYEVLLHTNLLLDWLSATYCQQYGTSVLQSAERQADLCANTQ